MDAPGYTLKIQVSLIDFLLNHRCRGPFNACAPASSAQHHFHPDAPHSLHRPALLPAPAWALRLTLGDVSAITSVDNASQPQRAQTAGFLALRRSPRSTPSTAISSVNSSIFIALLEGTGGPAIAPHSHLRQRSPSQKISDRGAKRWSQCSAQNRW